LTTMLRGSPEYVAGALWALAAIAIGAAGRGNMALSVTAAVAAVVVVVAAILVRRR
jgi:hypothetical protein